MGEQLTTIEQYGDLRGRIGIDGWHGLAVVSLAGCPEKNYWPVGLEWYAEPDQPGGELDPVVSVLAVDESILDRKGADGVRKYAKAHGQLPVFRFRTKLKLSRMLPDIKRLSIIVQDKCTEDAPLMLVGGDTSYGDEDEAFEDDSELDDDGNNDD